VQLSHYGELLHRANELLESANMAEWEDKCWRVINLRIENFAIDWRGRAFCRGVPQMDPARQLWRILRSGGTRKPESTFVGTDLTDRQRKGIGTRPIGCIPPLTSIQKSWQTDRPTLN